MRKPFALVVVVATLAAGATTVPAANPHASWSLSLNPSGCQINATATWSSVRVVEVQFYFFGPDGTYYATVTVPTGRRPVRSGEAVAGAPASAERTGRVDAIVVDAKGNGQGDGVALTEFYDVTGCSP